VIQRVRSTGTGCISPRQTPPPSRGPLDIPFHFHTTSFIILYTPSPNHPMAPLPPTLNPSPRLGSLHLFDQPSASLKRSGSASSHRSGLVPSPRPSHASLTDPQSGESSASGSRHGSFISTPRLLSRRNSAREQGPSGILRKISLKEHSTDEDLRIRAQAQDAQVYGSALAQN
jgi:hypothetical protein